MFVNKNQIPHAKYDRDQCVTCLRKLGYGGDKLAKILHIHKSTILKIIATRIPEPRYEGHDTLWKKLAIQKGGITRQGNCQEQIKEVTDLEPFEYDVGRIKDIKSFKRQETSYSALYSRKYRHLETQTKEKKRIPYNQEKERRASYRRKGVPEHLIPERGAYQEYLQTKFTPEEQKCIRRIRRKRDALRRSVTEVWKGKVGDSAAVYRVGCSVAKFREHIKRLMKPEWDELNYGMVWNFDHIKPCAAFDVFNRDHTKLLNHYSNIRPLCVMENSRKGANLLEGSTLY